MASPRLCLIEGCGKPAKSRGWCAMHFQRWYRTGDPLVASRSPATSYFVDVVLPYRGDDCLIWPYYRTPKGYARLMVDGRSKWVSRLVCEAACGSPPSPLHQAAHSCGNGHLGCVNPTHVRWATPSENEADKIRQGRVRGPRGAQVGTAKLTPDSVRRVRQLSSAMGPSQLARTFGVHERTIRNILSGLHWSWVV
jgi:DNA-binding CsgD family transcriptional regulator